MTLDVDMCTRLCMVCHDAGVYGKCRASWHHFTSIDQFSGHDARVCRKSRASWQSLERYTFTLTVMYIVPYPHVAEKIESGELLVKRLLQQIHFASGAVEVQFEFSAVV